MLELNQVYQGDCLELMQEIDDKSIDLILADLPYNVTRCKWDKEIPLDSLWPIYRRIIKDNGVILLTAKQPFTSKVVLSNYQMFRYEWVWEKTQATGFFNAKKQPLSAHENVLVFYKKQPTYNPQKTYGHKPMNSYTKKADVQNKTTVYGNVSKDVSGGGETSRFPRSVVIFSSDKQKTKLDGTIHPTQKPVALFEYLIKTYTNSGNVVLDNVAGSGTTGVACQNLNRNYILIEKELEYVEICKQRLKNNYGKER